MDPIKLECLEKAFKAADRDGSGSIDQEELALVLQLAGISLQGSAVEAMFAADTDGDGQISFEEFVNYVETNNVNAFGCLVDKIQSLRLAFELFDRDKSGGIDQEELGHVMAMVGVSIPSESVDAMFAADTDGDGQISFDEFISYLEKHSESTLSNVVEDIVALQKAFLETNKVDPRDDISEMVRKLRGSVASLTEDQVRVLVKLHSYTHKSDDKLKAIRGGTVLTRKIISSGDVVPFLSEQWGDPSLGGFFARKSATEGLSANAIIAQLGLDYKGSPYVSAKGPCGLVYIIEADVDIDLKALVPLDPRVREKVRLLAMKEGDECAEDAKKLFNQSYTCAVNDGSPEANRAPISLDPPYVGAGFCVHGSRFEGADTIEVKLVQELVAMTRDADNAKAQRISYSIGTGMWAQGEKGESWLVAVWNGKDWIPHFEKPSDIPQWLSKLEGKTQEELFAVWYSAIEAGASK